jgi:hypothetical protein
MFAVFDVTSEFRTVALCIIVDVNNIHVEL